MPRISDAEKHQVFRELHHPDRPIYQIAHARKGNVSEDYDSEAVRATSARIVDKHIDRPEGCFGVI